MRYLFPLLALTFALFACHDQDPDNSKYAGCCGTPATTAVFPISVSADSTPLFEARIYIPNLFLYNGVGINEIFMVFANTGVVEITASRLTDAAGKVLFQNEHVQPNDPQGGWNGFLANGERFEGKFDYQITVRLVDGQVKTLNGSACAYPCGEDGFPPENLNDCQFSTQNDGEGRFDPAIPSQSEFCFE